MLFLISIIINYKSKFNFQKTQYTYVQKIVFHENILFNTHKCIIISICFYTQKIIIRTLFFLSRLNVLLFFIFLSSCKNLIILIFCS